jgi:hypothetical protein
MSTKRKPAAEVCFKPFGIAAHLPFQRVAAGFRFTLT